MSVFELGGDDRRALLESARLNISSQQEPEYTEAEKTATGAAMGTMRALAESGRTALKLAGAAPVVYDAAKSAITGENTTSAQDAFFKTFVDNVGKDAIEYWTPQAEHTNKAGDIIGGVFGGLTQFAATGFNPFLFGAEAGLNTQGALTDQGVNLETSSKVGGVTAVASAAGAFLPPSVGGIFIKKLASGAAINLALGAAERGIDGAILQGEGYNKAAEQYSWKDSTSAAVDAFMGAAFGVMPSSMPAPKLKEVQDSVLTVASGKHAALDVAPGEPATPASAAIHHNALSAAIKQVIDGEPVNVGDKINKAEFSLRDELPSVKQLRGDLTDLLTEDGRNQFAQQLLDHQGPEGAYKTHEEARFVVDQFGAGIQKLHGAGVSMDRLSQLRTSFGKPAEAGAVFNQYAGQNAQGADLTALQRAKQSVDSGADAEQIRQETGWHRGPDNKWRFEIDDSKAVFKGGPTAEDAILRAVKAGESGKPVMLPDILRHESLFAAYPELKNIEIRFTEKGDPSSGAYSPEDNVIAIRGDLSAAEAKSTLLHEIQHTIQEQEGFARGGSASEFENQNNRAFNDRANATEKAIEFKKKAQEADANGGIHPVSGISAADLHSEHSQWMAERDAAHERLYSDGAPDANNQYKRLAGEVEARDTQARAGMSAEERKTSKPYASQGIPDDQVIIRHGNAGRMNSIDTQAKQGVDSNGEVNNYANAKADGQRGDLPQNSAGSEGRSGNNSAETGAERRRLRQLSQQRFRDDAAREFGQPILDPRSVEPGYRQVTRAGSRELSASHWSNEAAGGNSGTADSAVGVWAATKESSAAAYGDTLRDHIFHFNNPHEISAELWAQEKPATFEEGRALREKLLKYGYDGIIITGHDQYNHIIALHPDTLVKSSEKRMSENFVDHNALPTMDVSYDQKGGDAFARNIKGDTESPQGQINFGIDGEKLNATISLFETANKSTALHELSHNFLEIYKHLNQFDDTPTSIKEDYAEMRRLIGADDIGSPLKTEHHERFAQAFEQYTREGKAPTPALKRAFEHFKEWMTAIYQRAADLGAPINDDIRAMFDKMLGKEMPVEHFDPLLKNKDVQNELRRQAQNAGWAEVGGKVIMDENRVVTGRTSWMPKEEWYAAGMGSQADVERAVGKAIRGEKLSKKQQSIVAAMLDSPAHDAAREDMQLNAAMGKTTDGETPEQKAARMAEMDAFFDSIPEAAGVSDILKSADGLLVPQDDGSTVSARQLMESLHTELQESDAMPKVYDAAINCFLRG